MLALAAPRRRKAKAEPREIVDDRGLELGLATGAVQVFNAQNQAPADLGREALVHQRRIGVAEMERPVRRRREAQYGRGCEDVIGHGGKAHAEAGGPRNPAASARGGDGLPSRPADRR